MVMKVRVAHVLSSLDHGGVESLTLDLLRHFPPEIHSIVYYIGEQLTERRTEFEDSAAEFVHCPYLSPHRINFMRRLSARFRLDDVDAVLCYCFGNHTWVCMAAYWAGVRRSYVSVQSSPMRTRVARAKRLILSQ